MVSHTKGYARMNRRNRGNVHRAWIISVAAAALLFVGGCANKGSGKVVIGFMVKFPEEPWFQNEIKGARKCAEKYGFKVVDIGARDGDAVLAGIDNLAAQGRRAS